jgi:hypothetical protein
MEAYYNFGRTTFKNFVWMNGGQSLENPRELNIEMTSVGPFEVEVFLTSGALAGSGQLPNPIGGWHTFDFLQGNNFSPAIPNGMFRIRFVNHAGGTADAHGGSLTMYRPSILGTGSKVRGTTFGEWSGGSQLKRDQVRRLSRRSSRDVRGDRIIDLVPRVRCVTSPEITAKPGSFAT